jgi:hypothetical protein
MKIGSRSKISSAESVRGISRGERSSEHRVDHFDTRHFGAGLIQLALPRKSQNTVRQLGLKCFPHELLAAMAA